MKTALSIDDRLFEAGEELARERKISRSELYATALSKYLREQEECKLSEQYDRVFGALGGQDPETAELVRGVGKRTLGRSEW